MLIGGNIEASRDFEHSHQQSSRPVSMEIGNLRNGGPSATLGQQRRKDVEKNGCFECDKPGFSLKKCNPRANKISVSTEEPTAGGSEDIYPE